METSGCGVQDMESSDLRVEDADYQFNNVINDLLDEKYQIFLL